MAGGVLVVFFGLRLDRLLRRRRSRRSPFAGPTARASIARSSSAPPLFGLGWGLSGFCPGPAIADLGLMPADVVLFVVAMFVGSWIAGVAMDARPRRRPRPAPARHDRAAASTADIVAVVGAGPVGLAAAARSRARPATASRSSRPPAPHRPAHVGAARRLGRPPRAPRRLAALAPQSAPLRTLRIVDGTRRLIRAPEVTFDAGEIGLDAFGYNIPNAALVAALEAAVAARAIDRVTGLRRAGRARR